MELAILIITSLTFVSIFTFLFLYIKTEKKKKNTSEAEHLELRSSLSTIQNRIVDAENNLSKQLQDNFARVNYEFSQSFEKLTNSVKSAQDQANQNINLGFEKLQSENLAIQKGINEKVNDIKLAFQQYSKEVDNLLSNYNQNNSEYKKNAEQLKQQIHSELQNILKEIKSPLELD